MGELLEIILDLTSMVKTPRGCLVWIIIFIAFIFLCFYMDFR